SLSKTRTSYTTFGTSQQATALLAYLSERRDGGEKLSPDSPVVATHPTRGAARTKQSNATFSNGFLTTSVLMRELHEVLGSSLPEGVTWRPYVLRSYCSTRLMLAEGAGKMARDLREAILGHDTGISGRYNVGKPWGEEILKEARAQYKRAASFLETSGSP
ncbi:integrase/recombinase, partial [mine drainage metagenome]